MQEGNSVFNKIKIFIRNVKGLVFTAAILCVVIVFFVAAVGGASEKAELSTEIVAEAIKRAAVQCYAIEGFYPIELEYLTENYGLIIDEERFVVYYRAEMPNFLPTIMVEPVLHAR
jgi:hypothetical protein